MGNAPSSQAPKRKSSRRAPPQQAWGWEYRTKARAVSAQKRPLFKKQPSNNYNWWIFNPNAK